MTGKGYKVTTNNVAVTQAFGKTGDVANLSDSVGQNALVTQMSYGFYEGNNANGFWYEQAVGFPTLTAFSSTGSNNTAYMYDLGGSNYFASEPGDSHFANGTYYDQTVGFKFVSAFATNYNGDKSNDAAYMFDTTGTNTFVGTAAYSTLSGTGYFD